MAREPAHAAMIYVVAAETTTRSELDTKGVKRNGYLLRLNIGATLGQGDRIRSPELNVGARQPLYGALGKG